MALYEVAMLAEKIREKIALATNFTSFDLEKISREFAHQEMLNINVSHYLPKFFSNQSMLFSTLLSFSMISFNLLTPIKRRFIKHLLGRVGNMPQLLLEAKV